MTSRLNNTRLKLESAQPYVELSDTGGGANPCRWRAHNGYMKLQDVAPEAYRFAINALTGAIEDLVVETAKTDGQIGIPIVYGKALVGTWVADVEGEPGAPVSVVTWTPASPNAQYYGVEIPAWNKTTANKGIKPTGLDIAYRLNTSDTINDDLEFWIVKKTVPADGAATTVAILAGDDNADYDAAHNTKAERLDATGAPELHRATITIPLGAQAYLADNEMLELIVMVLDAAGNNLVLTLTSAQLHYNLAVL